MSRPVATVSPVTTLKWPLVPAAVPSIGAGFRAAAGRAASVAATAAIAKVLSFIVNPFPCASAGGHSGKNCDKLYGSAATLAGAEPCANFLFTAPRHLHERLFAPKDIDSCGLSAERWGR